MIEYPKVQQTGSDKWKLLETIRIYSEILKINVVVLRGFVTDFASVPQPFWGIIPPYGKYSTAALVHDYLYKNASKLKLTRKQCDLAFREFLIDSTCKKWRRHLMYFGVRIGGWVAFKQHKLKSVG